MKKKKWTDYLWIYTPVYLVLGFFNIMFAWLGMIEFMVPLLIVLFGKGKYFCNYICPKGQFFEFLGNKLKLSRRINPPKFLSSKGFRYGFLVFFMTMFILMIYRTFNVFRGVSELKEMLTVLWTFKFNFGFAYQGGSAWQANFAFGMYSMMFTSSILGFVTMLLFRPRTWCVYCPMGTMTQLIAKVRK